MHPDSSKPKKLSDLVEPQKTYSYGFLDAASKREIRRRILKAIAIPGYQVPYGSREMPIARGWGTGGLQATLSLVGPSDVVKVIDQGADDSVNAANLRRFISRMCSVNTTTDTQKSTIIQSRHRIPEEILKRDQILVLQVPDPEPLRGVEFNISKARELHAYKDYGMMWLKLYEQLVRYGRFIQGASYPAMVNQRHIMSPSPIPRWDTPKLHMAQNLTILSAGREKRIYAVPPLTSVQPLEFSDRYFQVENQADWICHQSKVRHKFMNEIPLDDGSSLHELSDTGYLQTLLRKQQQPESAAPGPTYFDDQGQFYHPGFLKSESKK